MDKSRGEFEEWAEHRYGEDELQLKPDDDESGEYSDEYENHLVQGEWEAWQASRKALVVELPNLLQPGADGPDDWYLHSDPEGEYMKADGVIDALRAAGITVKGEDG